MTTVWPVCRKRIPREVLRRLAWECMELELGERPKGSVQMPGGAASYALHAALSDECMDGDSWPGAGDCASLFMGLADLGDWRP